MEPLVSSSEMFMLTDRELCELVEKRSLSKAPMTNLNSSLKEFCVEEFDPYCLPDKVLCDLMDRLEPLPLSSIDIVAPNIVTPTRPSPSSTTINPKAEGTKRILVLPNRMLNPYKRPKPDPHR